MKVEKTTTGIIIRQPTDAVKQKCLQYFSLRNPLREYFIYSGNDPDNKSIFGGERDVIYITSGFGELNDKVCQDVNKHVSTITPREGAHVSFSMKYPPRSKFQNECIDKLTTSKSNKITVEAKPGLGKCEPYSVKIPTPTPSGYTLMGELKLGDFVFGRDGKPTKIHGIFEQGEKDVFEVTFNDSRVSYCGKEHLWTVRCDKETEWKTMTLEDIMNTDIYDHEYHIPICEPVQYPKQDVPIDPWILGYFISNRDLLSLLNLSAFYADKNILDAIVDKYDFNMTIRDKLIEFSDKDGNTIKTKEFFKDVRKIIAYDIIPDEYMFNDVETRINLLNGITSENCYMNIPFMSKVLYNQIYQLLHSLGYNNIHAFMSKDHTDNELLIKDIQYVRTEKCRCIMVDNDEHLYLTENYIVTHNTFIALDSISKLGLKPLIITPTTLLKNQWIDNLNELEIESSDIATNIIDSPNKKFCVVTISSIENLIRDDWKLLMDTLDKANFGIKIVDEAHLHLKGLLKLDAISNIKHNWYLSATLGRSDILEDNVLNRALKDADRFIGNATYEEYQTEYVNVYFQDIYYHPSAKLCNQCFRFGSKGLVRATYYNMLMQYKDGKPFMNNILYMIKRARQISPYGKILVLVPIINAINKAIDCMKQDPWFNNFTFAGVNGSMSLSVRKNAIDTSNIIVSTSMSMGTGIDLKDLAVVINFDQYASPIITEQIFGRLRNRKDGKETHYFDICDYVKYARTISNWGRKRRVLIPYFPGAHPEMNKLKKISV